MPWTIAAVLIALGALVMPGDELRASGPRPVFVGAGGQAGPNDPLDPLAERYVTLVLAVGQHDPDYVDAYYGPPEWRAEAEKNKTPLTQLAKDEEALRLDVEAVQSGGPRKGDEALWKLRHEYLGRQLASLGQRVAMLAGERKTFDEESQALYDAVSPKQNEADLEKILVQLEKLLPGDGPLIGRYDRFKQQFVIPRDKLDRVFQAAIRG